MGLVETNGGKAGEAYLLELSDEDLNLLHDAVHEQMAGVVANKFGYSQPTERELNRAGDLTSIHTVVARVEREREQGFPLTDEQIAEAISQARYFLSKMLHLPEDHVHVTRLAIDQERPEEMDGQRIKMFSPGDPGYKERDDAAKRERVISPEAIAKVIDALLNDPSTKPKSLPPA